MNLKFWSWELKFWTLLVLRRSVSHRWFPSPKQISRFHNQNLCENLNGAIFARTTWFLVKVHTKANSCRIILFEQFRILKWRNKSQKWNLREKLGKTGTSWKFWLFGQDSSKSQFFRNWTVCTISEFQMKKQISKSGCTRKNEWNRLFFKILIFWSKSKFYLVKAFSFSFSLFFFLFAGGSDRVTNSGRVQGNGSSWKWEVTSSWRHRAGGARVVAWGIVETRGRPKSARVSAWMTLVISEHFGGAWKRVAHRLRPNFLGFVNRGPLDWVVMPL